MTFPSILVDLKKIEQNANVITNTCSLLGIRVAGVVKACLGNIDVAKAMIAGGVELIADSRLENLERLSGLDISLMMLRQPMAGEIIRVVEITEVCLVSELSAVKLISDAAKSIRREYKIIVMVETGDLREGVLPGDLFGFVEEATRIPWINVAGIGTNVACLQGVPPMPTMLELLVDGAKQLRDNLGIELPIISGGNSSAWKLIESTLIPPGINQFRFGEAILLGQETINLDPIPGTDQDTVLLQAEVIEVKKKPLTANLEGLKVDQDDSQGAVRNRAILALGIQDIGRGDLKPLDEGIRTLRRSSDHLVVDVTDSETIYKVGDVMSFVPSYEAMLTAMTSPFVKKVFF